jgi:WD40 repeat protein
MNKIHSFLSLSFLVATSSILPLDEPLHKYLTASTFLPNNIWKTAFSPCSHYLAIPKQDIYGHDCVVVINCPNWHAKNKTDELYVYEEFECSSSIWSLAFGQQIINDLPGRHRSNLTVNRRFDFTKNLFLAAGLANGKINIWNIDTRELILVLMDHRATVCGLAFSPCSMQLASCSHDTTIKLWDLLDDGEKSLNFISNFKL